jgi:predicted nucleotidyltransferase
MAYEIVADTRANAIRQIQPVITIETVTKAVRRYVYEVRKVFHVSKVFLFGSWAKGTATKGSDVDVCFFLDSYEGNRRVDIIGDLLGLAYKQRAVDIEAIAFTTADLFDDNPFVKEVLRTGIEIWPGRDY